MIKDLVASCRSYRRFYEEERIPYEELKDMVDTARITGSAANSQALKYKIICGREECARIFPTIGWAAALTDWDGPAPGERPSAYIIMVCDLSIGKNRQWDEGITAQTIMLSAVEKGYGGCIIGNCRRAELLKLLDLNPEQYLSAWSWPLESQKKRLCWFRWARMAAPPITGTITRFTMYQNAAWMIS